MIDPQLERLGIRPAELLAGKYRVERVLGVGGMGAVVAAYHEQLQTRVAIKFLLPAMLANPETVARFAWEARNVVKISSEHVARVFDVGALENGAPYMVMEYLDGSDLAELLRQRGPLTFEDAVGYVLQAGEAIAEAHALGIVHRDLKPANLFCIRGADGRPSIKVLDFGISKFTGPSRPDASLVKTQAASMIGSPFYMAPEQMNRQQVDARTDIWALGIILFELTAGIVPFYGESVSEVSYSILMRPVPALRDYRPDAPPVLQAVLNRCLEKDREKRYSDVAQWAAALLPVASPRARLSIEKISAVIEGARLSASPLIPPVATTSQPPPPSQTVSQWGRSAARTTNRKAMTGLTAGIGALLVTAAVLGLRGSSDPSKGADGQHTKAVALGAAAATSTGGTNEECLEGADRCSAAGFATCKGGRWTQAVVTAGQCGAVCTPGSPAQCKANTPETCSPAGQWVDDEPCRYACSAGTCTGVCAPATHRCAGSAVQECDATGQWRAGPRCSGSCREGSCVTTPTTVTPAVSCDCSPNYTIDPQSGAHVFKTQCFRPPCSGTQ